MLAKLTSYLRSHHIALLALFVALGGTSYAAIKLPTNSVGSEQIKDGQVQKADVAKDVLGRSSLTPLRRGETIRGVIGAEGYNAQPGSSFQTATTLPIPAPVALDGDHIDVNSLEEYEDRCSGSADNPTAPQGVVCIYIDSHSNATDVQGIGAPGQSGSPWGIGLRWTAQQTGDYSISGTWAYTP
jgi:hypothetical protein